MTRRPAARSGRTASARAMRAAAAMLPAVAAVVLVIVVAWLSGAITLEGIPTVDVGGFAPGGAAAADGPSLGDVTLEAFDRIRLAAREAAATFLRAG